MCIRAHVRTRERACVCGRARSCAREGEGGRGRASESVFVRASFPPVRGEVVGQVEEAILDLAEEVGDVLIVEREAAAQQGVQDHPARPDVHLGAGIELARDHLVGRECGSERGRE